MRQIKIFLSGAAALTVILIAISCAIVIAETGARIQSTSFDVVAKERCGVVCLNKGMQAYGIIYASDAETKICQCAAKFTSAPGIEE